MIKMNIKITIQKEVIIYKGVEYCFEFISDKYMVIIYSKEPTKLETVRILREKILKKLGEPLIYKKITFCFKLDFPLWYEEEEDINYITTK